MKSKAMSDGARRLDAEAYQTAAREAWRRGEADGVLRLTVTSDSMRPLLRAGDMVVAQPVDPNALQPGEVLVVQRGGEWITHRLLAIDEQGWHTQGDNLRCADEAAAADQIVGRVIAIERGSQTIDLQQAGRRAIDRHINRVQRAQRRALIGARPISRGRPGLIRRGFTALLTWPFQMLVRLLIRLQ